MIFNSARCRSRKHTHISRISNSGTHLQSYTNIAIGDIARNSAPGTASGIDVVASNSECSCVFMETQCIFFATPNFNKRTETFQIKIDNMVRHMEDKVKNLRVIFDSRFSFEHHIKSLCSLLNGTLSYLNRLKNTLDQKSRKLLINALIFSHLNYCGSIWGKCSEKLQHELQKCINFAAKVASNGKYLKQDHVSPLLRDLKWINFSSILRLNEASFMYKNLYVSADSNVKMISHI